ncbi:unnamed protein product, partial [Ixodes pacificus]
MAVNVPAPVDPTQVAALAIRLPPFWPEDPQLWFAQVELQFLLRRITDQNTKFHHVVSALSSTDAAEVRDIIIAPPPVIPYDVLKDELVRRTGLSEQQRLQRTAEELGDKTPSQLLRRLKQLLANATIDDTLFCHLFLRLPNDVRMMLASADSATVEDFVKLADRIIIVSNASGVNQVTQPEKIPADFRTSIQHRVDELTEMVSALQSSRSPLQRTSRYPTRRFSQSHSPSTQQCWYHCTFGADTRKC